MTFEVWKNDEATIHRMQESVRAGRVSHAYLIEGPSYTDKPAFAREFAKAILCPRRVGDGCGQCAICSKVDHDNHEDLIWIRRMPGKKWIAIQQVEEMQAQIARKPNGPRYIVIIDPGDLLREDSQNRLLKTLEEPPGETVILILSENAQRLLPTIRSRCVMCRLEGVPKEADENVTQRAVQLTDQILDGSPYYLRTQTLGKIPKGGGDTAMLIDCMEKHCRELLFSRDEHGIPASPEEIGRLVDGLEKARAEIERGLSVEYALKKLLLSI